MKLYCKNTEEWRPIDGMPGYEVSSLGNVREGVRLLRQYSQGKYLFVVLKTKDGRKQHYVHRLVAIHFIANDRIDRTEVNHIDGVKTHNSADNLEWVTRSENQLHATRILGKVRCHKGKPLLANRKKVGVYNKEGELIRMFDSLKEAAVNLNVSKTNLSTHCRHKTSLKHLDVRYL